MMKTLLHSTTFFLAARCVLGAVFLIASIEKIANPGAFAESIGYYRLVGPALSMAAASFLPWLELLCGLGLLFGLGVRGSALLISAMLAVFTAAVAAALARGLDISCGCFSQDPASGAIGLWKLAENALLLLSSILLSFSRNFRFTLEQYFRST